MVFGLVALGFHLAGLVLSVSAVMSTRTAQGAVAWAVSLVSFPYVAVPPTWSWAVASSTGT
jgi:cardiolipin synthase